MRAELAKADATLQHDQAIEQRAELNLSCIRIVAPIDGVVAKRNLRVSGYLHAVRS
jgi:membrane fusion protein (multidrug efflux system)